MTNEDYSIPGTEGVYAGGDSVTGPDTVISAINAGKKIAYDIDRSLGYDHKIISKIEIPKPWIPEKPTARAAVIKADMETRLNTFQECERGLSPEDLLKECHRCLRCDRVIFK